MMAILSFHQFVCSISRIFPRLLRRAKCGEEAKGDAALVLGFERAADIAERTGFDQHHVRDRAHEHAVQAGGLRGEDLGQGGQIEIVFVRLQRGASFPRWMIYSPIPISIGALRHSGPHGSQPRMVIDCTFHNDLGG